VIIVRKILKYLLYLLAICLIPFIVEGMLNFYDNQYNAMTRPNAIITRSKGVHEGVNERLFNETRFRAEGLAVKLHCSGLTEVEADSIIKRLTGVFIVRTEEQYKNKEPGISFDFKLQSNLTRALNRVSSKYGVDNIDLLTNYEIECNLEPISFDDEAKARNSLLREFEVGEKVYLEIQLNGRVPPESEFVFTYSMCPRSVLRGTVLYGLDEKILNAFGLTW
jgi:hypothetical protein